MQEMGLVVGRSVSNYISCGHPIPKEAKIVPCAICGDQLALGSMGQRVLATGRGLVFCTPCMERIGSSGVLKPDDIITSPELREQMKRNPTVGEQLAKLVQSMRKG